MRYFTYKRFKGGGIDGAFNLKFGTIVTERDGFIHAPDGRRVCAVTSENGWEHFRPDTTEGSYRQDLLERIYSYYGSPESAVHAEDFSPERWEGSQNLYWKNLLRTRPTAELISYYKERLGEPLAKEARYV
jgi:hypothetical protein